MSQPNKEGRWTGRDANPARSDTMQLQLVVNMETATIEQLHRLHQQQLKPVDRLPALRRLSRDAGLNKSCAFKEFRFPPPYGGKKKDRQRKKLPPIPENMLPKRHNSFEEVDLEEYVRLPAISPAMTSEEKDERSLSETLKPTLVHPALFNVREFTFPVSSENRKTSSPVMTTPRVKELPIQTKIGKLARKKRKERAKKDRATRHDRGYQPVNDFSFPAREKINAFQPKREPRETHSQFYLKENKQLPFKQMSKPHDDTEKSKIPPRLYTRIVDSIYSYSKGKVQDGENSTARSSKRHDTLERIMVTPATARDDNNLKEDYHRHMNYLPPVL